MCALRCKLIFLHTVGNKNFISSLHHEASVTGYKFYASALHYNDPKTVIFTQKRLPFTVPFPVSWTVKMKKKQKETQDILSYHTQAAGCSDKARAKASGGRQPIEECGRTGL